MKSLKLAGMSSLIAFAGGSAGALATWVVLGRLQPTGVWFNDLLRALAVFVSSVAWPVVLVLVVVRHRPKIDELIDRVRAIGTTTTFDAPPQSAAPPLSPIIPATSAGAEEAGAVPPAPVQPPVDAGAGLPHDLAVLRSYVVVETERSIIAAADQENLQGAVRQQAFLTAAAVLSVYVRFEYVEGVIWASQRALLTFVNESTPPGASRADLKARFYDPAAAAWPLMFESYSFEDYLNFLRNHILVVDADDQRLVITHFGREYLTWRTAQARIGRNIG